jgi:hypothetical protein
LAASPQSPGSQFIGARHFGTTIGEGIVEFCVGWTRPSLPACYRSFLEDARPQGLEFFPQAARVHPRGETHRLKVLIVVKKEFFGNTAIAQRARYPLFKGFCKNGPP